MVNFIKEQIKNQSGITLIEVLATLTITAIIGSVVYAVLFQTLHANEKTKFIMNYGKKRILS